MALCTSGFRRFALVDVRRSAILQPELNLLQSRRLDQYPVA